MKWGWLVLFLCLGSCLPTTTSSVDEYSSYIKGKPTKRSVGNEVIQEKYIKTETTKRWVGIAKAPGGWETTTKTTDDSYQYELVYVGLTGSTIRLMYREYSNNFARPAFSQDLTYDLSQSKIITFRSYRIRVLEATNDSLKFVVLSDRTGSVEDKWKDVASASNTDTPPETTYEPAPQTTFNEKEFLPYSLNKKGSSVIFGQAFLKSRAGDVKYCAGNDVLLLPSTTLTREFWNWELYTNHTSPVLDPKAIQYQRIVVSNGEGKFRFETLPAGSYLLACRVDWYEGDKKVGGWAGAKVDIKDGEQKEVIVRAIESALVVFGEGDIRPDPTRPLTCGNGIKDKEEQCDRGKDNSNTIPDRCRTNCTLPHCGDGVLDSIETCDDGNTNDGDNCPASCLVVSPNCGNGTIDPGEQCDDGSANSDLGPCLPICRKKLN